MFRKKPAPIIAPEWMIVGLGNPGGEYKGTRHNVGFEVIDRIAAQNRAKLDKGRNRALTGTANLGGVSVLLVKPLTYMNLSGQSVGPLARTFNLKPDRILVVADDLDLETGRVKMKLKGSAGGHNGHKSLIGAIGMEYPRIKIGIGHVNRNHTIDHVLSSFDRDERPLIDEAVQLAAEACELACTQGINAALNRIALSNKNRGETVEEEDPT
ncbi:MAG TPA: aminoacyl-tRNA hydrolase [Fimbriimonadaceae bacterium]|jgi:PTH1 family peptidyl-tRNA hydrolase